MIDLGLIALAAAGLVALQLVAALEARARAGGRGRQLVAGAARLCPRGGPAARLIEGDQSRSAEPAREEVGHG